MTDAKTNGSQMQVQIFIDGTWLTLGETKSDGITLTNEQVDTSNKSEAPWKQLSACGVRSVAFNCSGVISGLTTGALQALHFGAVMGTTVHARLQSGDGAGGLRQQYEGDYLVVTFGRSGEYNQAEMFNLSLDSASLIGGCLLPPIQITPSTISGSYTLGSTLTCEPGLWSGCGAIEYIYQWYLPGNPDPQYTSKTHTINADDDGKALYCIVTASNDAGSTTAPQTAIAGNQFYYDYGLHGGNLNDNGVNYWNGGENLPAGTYKISYVSGAFYPVSSSDRTVFIIDWNGSLGSANTLASQTTTALHSIIGNWFPANTHPNIATCSFASESLAEADNAGQSVTFVWPGADVMGISLIHGQFQGTPNTAGTTVGNVPQYRLERMA
jgi:predicted secreted protein